MVELTSRVIEKAATAKIIEEEQLRRRCCRLAVATGLRSRINGDMRMLLLSLLLGLIDPMGRYLCMADLTGLSDAVSISLILVAVSFSGCEDGISFHSLLTSTRLPLPSFLPSAPTHPLLPAPARETISPSSSPVGPRALHLPAFACDWTLILTC